MEIVAEGLSKAWSGVPVLRDASLSLAAGEFVALVGRSGAGKSTLLNLLAGIDVPDAGTIRLGGVDLTALDDDARTALRRERFGLVFQEHNLVPSLDVLDNVRLPLELVGRSPSAAREVALALLRELGVDALAKRLPESLSGGEQQRVAVARAVAHGPGFVFADEPTGSLDWDNARRVLSLLVGACRERGIGLLMATHSHEVMGQADRLLRIEDGRLVPA